MAAGIVAALLTATLAQMISCSSYEISQLLDLHYRPSLYVCSSNTLPFVKKPLMCSPLFVFPVLFGWAYSGNFSPAVSQLAQTTGAASNKWRPVQRGKLKQEEVET